MTKRGRNWRLIPLSLLLGVFSLFGFPSKAQNVGDQFRDCPNCPEMIVLPSGSFLMGSLLEETEREKVPTLSRGNPADWERPRHRVTIAEPFALSVTEVTVGEFLAFVSQKTYRTEFNCSAHVPGMPFAEKDVGHWTTPAYPQTAEHPVVCVNWQDAQAYVAWLSEKTGATYRLPTEAEWEYAARGGTDSARYWGNSLEPACTYENVPDQAFGTEDLIDTEPYASLQQRFLCNDGHKVAAPVGQFRPNPFGLYDMIGNAREWVQDCMHESYEGAPGDGSAWETDCQISDRPGTEGQVMRVRRGAGWNYLPHGMRAARRGAYPSSIRSWTLGLRVVRQLSNP